MMENERPLHRRGLDLCPGVNATVHILLLLTIEITCTWSRLFGQAAACGSFQTDDDS